VATSKSYDVRQTTGTLLSKDMPGTPRYEGWPANDS
jgi:hypothetical protein